MNRPSIDLIICTYNHAPLLEKALEAISRQNVSAEIGWQVLVVNNNCTDQTPEVVEKFAKNFPVPLKTIVETKQGLHHARICGIKNTEGDWAAFVDDDCLIAENFVEEIAKFVAEYPDCGAFGAKIILEWEIEPPLYALRRKWAFAGRNHGDSPKRREWIAGTGMILRREFLKKSGWIEKQFLEDRVGQSLISGGDVEMGLRIARIAEVWYNPACQLRHLIPARRLTREYLRKITFGLGSSRHNVAALQWRGSYLTWFFYSLIYSVGLVIFSIIDAASEFISSHKGADIPTAFAPVFGWWSAMWTMFRLDKNERRALLGGAVRDKI
jgi:glycosyltransferase involved in cell wall biosynthesis